LYKLNVSLTGAACVGKSTILQSYIKGECKEILPPTSGFDFRIINFSFNKKNV
jgi:GTPase SAR1 family protein